MTNPVEEELPMDRGYAWVISFSSMAIFCLMAGNYKAQGILLVELAEKFPDEPAMKILWVTASAAVLAKFGGPLYGLILSKTSYRTQAMIGITITALAWATVGYLPRIDYMYPVFGILGGCGDGMLYLVVFTAYKDYFVKRKALAVGITAAGSGIGTLAISPLQRLLFNSNPFSAAVLLYGGFILQFLIPASLLRPINFYRRKSSRKAESDDKQDSPEHGPDDGELMVEESLQEDTLQVTTRGMESLELDTKNELTTQILYGSSNELSSSGLLYVLQEENNKQVKANKRPKKYDWRLAMSPHSVLVGLSSMTYLAGFGIVYQCLPLLAKSSGVSKDFTAILLACAGALEIPSRILNGFLADKKYVNAITQQSICMLLNALGALFCALVPGIPGIAVMLFTASAGGTSVFSLNPIVIEELLGSKNVMTIVSINEVYKSISFIVTTFVAGKIYDATKKWEMVFFYAFGMMALGGITDLAHAIHFRMKTRQHQEDNKATR